MTQSPRRVLAILLCLCTVGQAVAIAPAAAASTGGPDGQFGLVGPGPATPANESGLMEAVGNAVAHAAGTAARAVDSIDANDSTANATVYANDTAEAIEANDEALRDLANEKFEADGADDDVVRVVFTDKAGHEATRYVVADVEGSEWVDGPRVLTPEEFEDSDKDVDHRVKLDPYASRHADEQVERLADDADDESSSIALKARLIATFGSGVESDLL